MQIPQNFYNNTKTFSQNKEIPINDNSNTRSQIFQRVIPEIINNHYQEIIIPAGNGYYSLEYRIMGTKKEVVIWFVRNDIDSWPYDLKFRSDSLRIGGGNRDRNSKMILDSYFGADDTFEDSLRNISVKVLEVDNATATIEVSL